MFTHLTLKIFQYNDLSRWKMMLFVIVPLQCLTFASFLFADLMAPPQPARKVWTKSWLRSKCITENLAHFYVKSFYILLVVTPNISYWSTFYWFYWLINACIGILGLFAILCVRPDHSACNYCNGQFDRFTQIHLSPMQTWYNLYFYSIKKWLIHFARKQKILKFC